MDESSYKRLAPTKCHICERNGAQYRHEYVTIGDETFPVCDTCTDSISGNGAHEGIHESDRALCLVLESLAGVSGEDHLLTDDNYGYAGLFDRFILLHDDRGFYEVREFKTAELAMREMNQFEDDGFGASEYDAWIYDDRNGYGVSFEGKHIATFTSEDSPNPLRRARAQVSLCMRESGYYPNCFYQGERGSVRRIEVW